MYVGLVRRLLWDADRMCMMLGRVEFGPLVDGFCDLLQFMGELYYTPRAFFNVFYTIL